MCANKIEIKCCTHTLYALFNEKMTLVVKSNVYGALTVVYTSVLCNKFELNYLCETLCSNAFYKTFENITTDS